MTDEDRESLVFAASGKPYDSVESAAAAMKRKGMLKEDFEIVPVADGFGVRLLEPSEEELEQAESSLASGEEKYFRVIFDDKSNVNDLDSVQLGCNGEFLVIARQTEVVLPERFLEVARHGGYPVSRQEPGKPRKTTGMVTYFPFRSLGPATRDEYLRSKAEGTAKTKRSLAQFGPDGPPEG